MTIDEFMRDIAPKMRPGWAAMDKDGNWFYYSTLPKRGKGTVIWWAKDSVSRELDLFDIAPVDDWTQSLRKVGE